MNILHFSAVKSWGGGGNYIENLVYELSKSNPEVKSLIVVARDGQFHDRLKNSQFLYSTVPLAINVDPRAVFKLISLCKKHRIDLVHLHGATSLTLAVIATKMAELPPFIFSKKTSFPIKNRKRTLFKYNHPQIKKIICVSEEVRRITESAIVDKEKLVTIYDGTRTDEKPISQSYELRKMLNLSAETKIIGHIGNHIKAKDLETWIAAINELVNIRKNQNLFFVQIGTFSKLTPAIQQKVEEYNLEESIKILGYLPDASAFMPEFEILMLSSKSEGLPQVIFEAAKYKVLMVSTNVGGIPEFIDHKVNGLLSGKEDAVGLAENVEVLLANPELGKTFAERSHKKLFPEFSTEYMAQKTLQEYRKVLKSRH
ncbi:glycosyltransferase family 4 protein [Antarcticibacterium sp. 1MA-6-2]|uniref:glycosyltransferase family 4 protein n=1 Tax=Antarcticibacterium sp. 1MA-6-2 TaxID=2908210 RepID=UPI001F32DA24|nr:glycosyltransferase family 4 protein [Antarcticibacterium sp. 1MA-6-2]UJH92199.1 glycosyltransferase family 4 protein [Antarcticibacterium sp. 1MA-6-2]